MSGSGCGLLIHAGALGDTLLALRVAAAMRAAGVERVVMLGRGEFADLALASGVVQEVVDIDRSGSHALFAEDVPLPERLGAVIRGCRIAVDMLGGESAVASRLSECGVSRVFCIDPRAREAWPGHVTEQWLADLRAAGMAFSSDPAMPLLHAPRSVRSAKESRAIIAPGSGSRMKCWPIERFIQVADAMRETGYVVSFLLGPVERERFSVETQRRIGAVAEVLQDLSIGELAVHLRECGMYVGNDSGTSHLAALMGVATVAVFGPTDARLWRPLGPRVLVVEANAGEAWPEASSVMAAISAIRT